MNRLLIRSYSDYKSFISADRISQGGGNIYKKFFVSPVFRFTVLLRFNEYLFNNKIFLPFRIIPLIWYKRLSVRLGFSIPFNVFDCGLGIVHYGLLIVNSDAQIGKNCRLHAGVNIGGSAGFKKAGDINSYAPIIGDNCYLGPGTKLFGAIKIGDNTVVGANAVVNRSFGGNCTIGGVPAKKISDKNSDGLVYIS